MNPRTRAIIIGIIVIAVIAFILFFMNRNAGPVINTYSVTGQIVVVNDCSGNGADNDKNVDVTAKFFYKPLSATNFSRKTQPIAMVLGADGVTTTGNYNLIDVPTNQVLDHIELDIEE